MKVCVAVYASQYCLNTTLPYYCKVTVPIQYIIYAVKNLLHGILENEMLFKKQDVLLLGRQTLEVDALHHQLLLSQQYRINIELHQLL